jgi:hypothetical protein
MAADLAGLGYHTNRSNPLVLESQADMLKRGRRARTTASRWRWLPAAHEAGGSRRTGRRGGIRAFQREQQLGVDAMTAPGACTANR